MTAPSTTNEIYLTCVRRKGHPKKHIDVCHQCRWRNNCKPYRRYLQPGLPFEPSTSKRSRKPPAQPNPSKIDKTPPPPDKAALTTDDLRDLIHLIKKELEDVRDLCS